MKQFKAPFKVKVETESKYNEMLVTFKEMLEGWKYKKEGRSYTMEEDKDNLTIIINAFSK
jgi:hypothetical protein